MSLLNTTAKIDREFALLISEQTIESVSRDSFFECDVAPWIAKNVSPEMVFETETLEDWAKEQDVESVCDKEKLHKWADENGYTKND